MATTTTTTMRRERCYALVSVAGVAKKKRSADVVVACATRVASTLHCSTPHSTKATSVSLLRIAAALTAAFIIASM
jgi:hypothetical protein